MYGKIGEGTDRAIAGQALIRLAEAYQKLGDLQARGVYERIVRDFGDQREVVAAARTRLLAMRPVTSESVVQATRRIWSGAEVGVGGTPSIDGRYLSFQFGSTGYLALLTW